MARVSESSTPAWCDQKIITYDFCLESPGGCYSGTTSPAGIYPSSNGKVYYVIPSSPISYIWWNSIQNRWEFSQTLGVESGIYLEHTGEYPYSSSINWSGDFTEGAYFRTCDCTCFTEPNYTPPNYLPTNECGIITIYPMGIQCFPIQPINPNGYGSLTITITGGTPPYIVKVINPNGSRLGNLYTINSNSLNIPNLISGTYFIEVTDQFGDFQQVISCTIPQTTTTTTTTIPPLPPTPSYLEYSFCITFNLYNAPKKTNDVYSLTFRLSGFNNVNNNPTPNWITQSGYEIVYWNTTNNYWTLSASSSSSLVTTYLGPPTWNVFNTNPITSYPFNGSWNYVGTPFGAFVVLNLNVIRNICQTPLLNFFINESWWQFYNSNMPSLNRGTGCSGGNQTPSFGWNTQNLPSGISVLSYEILCTKQGLGTTNLDVINIPSNITSLNSTTVWPGGVTINTPTATGTMNSQGWIGPCPIFGSTGYDVTLVANLSNFTTLTSSVQFIVCTQVINGACYI